MSKKIRVKLILRLAESGMSQNAIARLHHISKRSINDVLGIAKERDISFGDVAELTDEEAYRRFYPDKHAYEVMRFALAIPSSMRPSCRKFFF